MGNVKVRVVATLSPPEAGGESEIDEQRQMVTQNAEWHPGERMSLVYSLRPENPIAGIAETGKDVAMFVELAVEHR